jgi:glycosyltransferase involved in cell wall biosynthesis
METAARRSKAGALFVHGEPVSLNLGVVVPCYNEQEVLRETSSRMLDLFTRLKSAGKITDASTIYFVDDGSTDSTWNIIEELSRQHDHIGGIKLSRNRGHQNALLAGLFTADGDALVSVDADLQDDITIIETMVDEFANGMDVVYGVRKKREQDTVFKRLTAESFYRAMRVMGAETIYNHADFRLLSRRAIEALKDFREVNLFIRGIVPLIGYRSGVVYYNRNERFAGESKYPLRKMIEFALDAITSFSVVPLRMITAIGFAVFVLTLFLSAWILWIKLTDDLAVPGWASTLLPLLFIGGIQILCLGVMGEYLGKIYIETKSRPRYFIEQMTLRARGRRTAPVPQVVERFHRAG